MSELRGMVAGKSRGQALCGGLLGWLGLLLIFGLLLNTGLPAHVHAHGGDWDLQIPGHRTGEYIVIARTSPNPPREGHLHVQVQLMASGELRYIEDAEVGATASLLEEAAGQVGPVSAAHNGTWYEMDLPLTRGGQWEVELALDGPRGNAQARFYVDVLPDESGLLGLPTPVAISVIAMVSVLSGVVLATFFRSRRWGRHVHGSDFQERVDLPFR